MMSQATQRHEHAVPLKNELLKELKHWADASNNCMRELNNTLNSLKVSRDVAKREIHSARALLEEHLRMMEERALDKLQAMVQGEMKKLKEFLKKLKSQQMRIATTATSLGDNVIGVRLVRAIQDGKEQIGALQEILIDIRKQNFASKVAFDLNDHLNPVVNGDCTLGTSTLKSVQGERQLATNVPSKTDRLFLTRPDDIDAEQQVIVKIGEFRTSVDPTYNAKFADEGKHRLDESYIDKLQRLENEITTTLQKTRMQAQKVSPSEETPYTCVSGAGKTKASTKTMKFTASRIQDQMTSFNRNGFTPDKVDFRRPQSLRPSVFRNRDQITLHVRISKSARDDTRLAPNEPRNGGPIENEVFLNQFQPFDEQGPDRFNDDERKTKHKPSVRYLGYDFIKEITSLDGISDDIVSLEDNEKVKDLSDLGMEDQKNFVPPTMPLTRSSTRSTTNTSISSVSYKPSSRHASGPVHLPSRRPSKSYFTYSSRFHTKKHPDDTDLCRLAGIVALETGQVVISDINHLQVMLFAPDYTYLFALKCPSPSGMCLVDTNTIAVALFHNRKILLVKVHSIHMEKIREIHLNCSETLFAVSFRNDQYYILCFGGGIHVLGKDGKQLRAINTCISGGIARHLEVSEDGQKIFVTTSDCVSCFNEFGERLWQYRPGKKHFTPGGILLHWGRLFVTNWRAHKVLELSLDGTHVRDVVVDNVEYPQFLAVHAPSGKLFVTQSHMFKQEAQTRKIRVFDIK